MWNLICNMIQTLFVYSSWQKFLEQCGNIVGTRKQRGNGKPCFDWPLPRVFLGSYCDSNERAIETTPPFNIITQSELRREQRSISLNAEVWWQFINPGFETLTVQQRNSYSVSFHFFKFNKSVEWCFGMNLWVFYNVIKGTFVLEIPMWFFRIYSNQIVRI